MSLEDMTGCFYAMRSPQNIFISIPKNAIVSLF